MHREHGVQLLILIGKFQQKQIHINQLRCGEGEALFAFTAFTVAAPKYKPRTLSGTTTPTCAHAMTTKNLASTWSD